MRISFNDLKAEFIRVLLRLDFSWEKAEQCAHIFAENSLVGVYSHGLNRFPVFVEAVRDGLVKVNTEPEIVEKDGLIERWDGGLGPGMLNAKFCMDQAIALAKENGMSCVALRNTNHWMRGGTYGWQAADAGCIGICFTNTIANMPPWGGIDPRLGNNPLIIAIPRSNGHVILDTAMSQFSYGKMQAYDLKKEQLPVAGGFDENGILTQDPAKIMASRRPLPIGFWKGSGLSLMLDILATILSKGKSTSAITSQGKEYGLSQVFICIHQEDKLMANKLTEEILNYTKSSRNEIPEGRISYPGENTLQTKLKNMKEGIPVDEAIWEKVLSL